MSGWLDARNILAVRLDNAGDVVMLGPALRAVKETSPVARITLLASPAGGAAAPLLPWVDETIVWRAVWQDLGRLPFEPARELELVALLRDRAFDAALIFTSFSQTPHAPGYACYLAGVPLRAGQSKEFGGAILTDELRGAPDDLHQVERNLRLVEALGFAVPDRSLAVAIPAAARSEARTALRQAGVDPTRPYLVVHPGASAEARRYPADRWGEAARLLNARGWQVVLTGVEKERAQVEAAAALAPRAVSLIGATTMCEYAAVVAGAALVLCGNTLPLHLADAVRTPVLALYSGTDLVSQWRPRNTPSRLLRRETPCHPCYGFTCDRGLACLAFSPAEVADAAEEALCGPHSTAIESGASTPRGQRRPVAPADPAERRPLRVAGRDHRSAAETGAPRSIAVFQALALGDLLCLTPALRSLRERYPEAEITFIGAPWAESLLLRLGSVDRFLAFPGYPGIAESPPDLPRLERFLDELRREPFDLALQMHGSGSVSNGFVAALWARFAAGYRAGADDRLELTLPWIEDESEQLRWLRLAAAVGADGAPRPTEFPLTADDRSAADAIVAGFAAEPGPIAGLHIGAKDPARRWPPERFAELADALVIERGARIVLTGDAAEAALTAAVHDGMTAPALDLAGRTDLGAFAAVIGALDLLVTNDTGASHIAAALGTPSVVLFGPTRPARWAPLDRDRHRVLDARSVHPDLDPASALAALPVPLVVGAALAQLDRVGRRAADATRSKEARTCTA